MADTIEPSILQIEGYTMRPVRDTDLDTLTAIWADAEVTRFLPSRGIPIPKADVEKSLSSFIHHWKVRGYGIWTIKKILRLRWWDIVVFAILMN